MTVKEAKIFLFSVNFFTKYTERICMIVLQQLILQLTLYILYISVE